MSKTLKVLSYAEMCLAHDELMRDPKIVAFAPHVLAYNRRHDPSPFRDFNLASPTDELFYAAQEVYRPCANSIDLMVDLICDIVRYYAADGDQIDAASDYLADAMSPLLRFNFSEGETPMLMLDEAA